MITEIFKGLSITLRELFKPAVTIQYPEVKRPVRQRFRGRHELRRYADGLERCIGCALCAAACPAEAIYVEAAENTDAERYSPGERYAKTYEINMLRCIFCGYCQAACPTGAITLEKEFKLAAYYPEDLIYHKEMLLEPKGQATTGSNAVWAEPAPEDAIQPVPQETHTFDGSSASAAAVGLGTMHTERVNLLVNEDQDEDRRKLEKL